MSRFVGLKETVEKEIKTAKIASKKTKPQEEVKETSEE